MTYMNSVIKIQTLRIRPNCNNFTIVTDIVNVPAWHYSKYYC